MSHGKEMKKMMNDRMTLKSSILSERQQRMMKEFLSNYKYKMKDKKYFILQQRQYNISNSRMFHNVACFY
jgi:hypothetical protein